MAHGGTHKMERRSTLAPPIVVRPPRVRPPSTAQGPSPILKRRRNLRRNSFSVPPPPPFASHTGTEGARLPSQQSSVSAPFSAVSRSWPRTALQRYELRSLHLPHLATPQNQFSN
mmetsp:Transcript_30065/g.30427  ORF Transcript_30065/g.30427 Transcript_30065/m.30427 type:complete len:115 (-) Transcript_30065:50-394(-)